MLKRIVDLRKICKSPAGRERRFFKTTPNDNRALLIREINIGRELYEYLCDHEKNI